MNEPKLNMIEDTYNDPQTGPINIVVVFLKLMFTGIVAALILGIFCNGINAKICDEYYLIVMHWNFQVNSVSLFYAIIAQGIFEGFLFGVGFSLIFTIAALCIFKRECSYYLGLSYLVIIVFGAFLGWFIGGIVGCGLAFLSEDWIRTQFMQGHISISPIRFAWVGGSICGMELGGLLSLLLAVVMMHQKSLTFGK
ncbi:MAG: hypothetical protein LBT09_15760 [Planctomycetaceae bacterium]|jgi:hypothetical protein|nr:hypothetical protein [Planctomycetaceae bacterium]